MSDMLNTYMITTERYGRLESLPDVNRFAWDLAAKLGGVMSVEDEPSEYTATFHIRSKGYTIHVTGGHWERNHNGRVTLSIHCSEVLHRDLPGYCGIDDRYKMPVITVSVARNMDRIAVDVKWRLLNAAAAPAWEIREYAATRIAGRAAMAATIERFKKLFPELSIEVNSDDGDTARFYMHDPIYMVGRVSSHGVVTFDRIGSVSEIFFTKFLALARDEKTPI